MNDELFEGIARLLQSDFPDASVEISKADDPKGFRFLHFFLIKDDKLVAAYIEWKPGYRIGIAVDINKEDNLVGFEPPDEYYDEPLYVHYKLKQYIQECKSTNENSKKTS